MLKNQRGGAAVEFAIVVPLLALILFGTIDFALLFYNKQVLTNASREGARAAIVADNWNPPEGELPDTDDEDLQDKFKIIIQNYYSGRLINLGGEDDPPTSTILSAGNFITATVTYDYNHLFNAITGFSKTTITGKTVMRQEW